MNYQELLDRSETLFVEYDSDDLITWCNLSFSEYDGRDREEIIGTTFALAPASDPDSESTLDGVVWASPIPSETGFIRSGTRTDVRVKQPEPELDAESELERLEQIVALSERMAGVGHWHVDLVAETLFWSAGVHEIHQTNPLNFTPTLAEGIDFYHPDDRDAVSTAISTAIAEKTGFEFEKRIIRTDGKVRQVHSRGVCELGPDGEVVGIFGVFRDETERNDLREKVSRHERLASLGTLAAGIAHELNNPLAYVLSSVDFASQEFAELSAGSPSQRLTQIREALEDARDGSLRARDIVHGLRAFTNASSQTERCYLSRTATFAARLCSNEAHDRVATIDIDLDHLPAIEAQEGKLIQIFVNLIANAAKAHDATTFESNYIRIHGETTPTSIRVIVEDNGSGMSPEVMQNIFDPFFTTRRERDGTGLGLSIASGNIRSLNGTIEVESELGVGTRFTLTFPFQQDDATEVDPIPVVTIVSKDPLMLRTLRRTISSKLVVHVDCLTDLSGDSANGVWIVDCDTVPVERFLEPGRPRPDSLIVCSRSSLHHRRIPPRSVAVSAMDKHALVESIRGLLA